MCGIGGFFIEGSLSNGLYRYVRSLHLLLSQRGKDASGVYTNSPSKGWVSKQPLPVEKFDDYPLTWGDVVLLHTRQATHGSPENNFNNHPLISKSGMVMVHNGVVYMRPLTNYPYSGETDSEVLLSYIEEFGISKALSMVSGDAAIALYNPGNGSLYLWRWGRPLSIGMLSFKSGKMLVFASTSQIIHRWYRTFWKPELGIFDKISIHEMENGELLSIKSIKGLKITQKFILGKDFGCSKFLKIIGGKDEKGIRILS